MAIGTLVLVASTWLAGTSASYASVNRINVQVTMGTTPRPGHKELVRLTEGSTNPPEDECPAQDWICKDQGSYASDVYECPSLDGNTRVTPNGDQQKLYCNTGTHRKTSEVVTSDSFVACVDTCSETEGCVGVGWNRMDLTCDLKSEYITDTYPTVASNDIDSSSEQCPSYEPESDECPRLNWKIRCDFGEQFRIYCNLSLQSTNLVRYAADDLGSCMEQCAAIPECKGADYNRVTKWCHTKSAYKDVPTMPNPDVDSFVLVQRRCR